MRQRKIISNLFLASIKLSYGILASSAEPLCRHSFGERYRASMLMGFGGYLCYASCVHAILPSATPLLGYFTVLYSMLTIFHLVSITFRGGTHIHSYSTGMSWGFWSQCGLNGSVVQLLAEPGMFGLVGCGISYWDEPLAFWLYGAGLCLFVKEARGAWHRRRRVLDAIDARLEGERINEAIRQRTAPRGRRSQSTQIVEAAQSSGATSLQQTEMFSNLDPGLQNLLSETQGESPAQPAKPAAGTSQPGGGPLGNLPRIVSPRRYKTQ